MTNKGKRAGPVQIQAAEVRARLVCILRRQYVFCMERVTVCCGLVIAGASGERGMEGLLLSLIASLSLYFSLHRAENLGAFGGLKFVCYICIKCANYTFVGK